MEEGWDSEKNQFITRITRKNLEVSNLPLKFLELESTQCFLNLILVLIYMSLIIKGKFISYKNMPFQKQ